MLGSYQLHQACDQVGVISHFQMRTSNVNRKKIRSYRFEVSVLVPNLDDLGFFSETIIFKTWNLSYLIGYKDVPP